MKIELYKWPPSLGVDAPNPRGVTVNRILAYLGVNYDAKIVSPTRADLDPRRLGIWMSGFPILAIDGKPVNGIYRILRYLCENINDTEKATHLWSDGGGAAEVAAWSFDHLYYLAIYARMRREVNFQNYLKHTTSAYTKEVASQTFGLIRELFVESLKWSSVGQLNEAEFALVLDSAFASLEQRVTKSGKFLLGSKVPTVADFAAFGFVQALLAPDIEERGMVIHKFPGVVAWAREIDYLSSGKWTRPLVNL